MWVPMLETSITPVSFGAYHRDAARILALYTAPEYQKRGLATRLMERFLDVAREDRQDFLQVTAPKNAQDFFERFDFQALNPQECHDLVMVQMRRSLQ